MAQSIIWNRTANTRGQPGCNIPLDFLNELLNRDFKDNLDNSGGHYEKDTVEVMSKIVGATAQACDRMYEGIVCGSYTYASKQTHTYPRQTDVIIGNYISDHLFNSIPGRHHSAFPDYVRPHDFNRTQFDTKIKECNIQYDKIVKYQPTT